MNATKIEWVKNPDGSQGYTLNDKTGCTNHTPEGLCLGGLFPCYAYKLANGRLKQRYLANTTFRQYKEKYDPLELRDIAFYGKDPFYPRFWEEKLNQPYQRKKPMGIFLDDMSDWMLDCWPKAYTEAELQMMRDNPQHRIYTLTKQPQRLPEFSPFPENCWVGVTACNEDMWTKALWELSKVQAPVKYISIEPFLKRIPQYVGGIKNCGISWLIIGACTGTWSEMDRLERKVAPLFPYTLMQWGNKWTLQPKIEWIQEIVEAADKAGIPVFLKDNLKPLFEQVYGQDPHSYYYHNGLRQEMPIEQ